MTANFYCPDYSFVDSQVRKLIHCLFEVTRIDFKKNVCSIKPKLIQPNPTSGKIYTKYLRVQTKDGIVPFTELNLKLPPKELTEPYEVKKQNFIDKNNQDIIVALRKMEDTKRKIYRHNCYKCNYKWEGNLKNPIKCPNCSTREWRTEKE